MEGALFGGEPREELGVRRVRSLVDELGLKKWFGFFWNISGTDELLDYISLLKPFDSPRLKRMCWVLSAPSSRGI